MDAQIGLTIRSSWRVGFGGSTGGARKTPCGKPASRPGGCIRTMWVPYAAIKEFAAEARKRRPDAKLYVGKENLRRRVPRSEREFVE